MSAKVLAIANQKGGVGKTTTALTLAAALTRKGKKVLVLDLDPHCCASVHVRLYPEEVRASVLDIFTTGAAVSPELWSRVIQRPDGLDFDMVPAKTQLSDLEADLKERKGKGSILRNAVAGVRDRYDFIIFDCPPHLGILLVNALVASDLLIIPIQTDFLAVHGLKLLVDTLRVLNKALPQPLEFKALATMYDRRANACERVLRLLHNKMGSQVFSTVIGLDTKFREASGQGTVIYTVDQSSRGAKAYESLAEEIVELW